MNNLKFRWTIGDVSDLGVDIFKESIELAKKNFTSIDFYVCFNGNKNLEKIQALCKKYNLNLIISDWNKNFPLPMDVVFNDKEQRFENSIFNHSFPSGRQGSFWKLCPPRLFPNNYEIICDNDVLIQNIPNELNDFLCSDRPLIAQEDVICLGKYFELVDQPYNSGLFGLPPGFDFQKHLVNKWKHTGAMSPLYSRDEQGLIIATLKDHNPLEIPANKISHIHDSGKACKIEYEIKKESGHNTKLISSMQFELPCFNNHILHFLGANRLDNHKYWSKYKLRKYIKC